MAAHAFRFLILFSTVGFPLHLTSELAPCSHFFLQFNAPPSPIAMLRAAEGDLMMMWLVYFVIALRHKSLHCFQKTWGYGIWIEIAGTSTLLAIFIESWALQIHRWSYTESNSALALPGLSLLPLLQMALINPAAMILSKRFNLLKSIKHTSKENR